jgi:P-type E1-E2 ATPase
LRRLGDQLGAWYTPLALAVAAAAGFLSADAHRFLAVVVIATPCPLLLAIPVAIIAAISVAGQSGIIIKNPTVLEQADRCRTLIFDKTGTLTYGRPALVGIQKAPGVSTEQVLRLAHAFERATEWNRHPPSACQAK